jgi:hypothetical protein
MMVKLCTLDKRGDESWHRGDYAYINPAHVIAIESKEHRWHSFRPGQTYATVHLSTGTAIDVYEDATEAQAKVDEAMDDEFSKDAIDRDHEALTLRQALDPVWDWFNGDGEIPEPDPIEVVKSLVVEIQDERKHTLELMKVMAFYADEANWDNEYEASDGYRTTTISMYGGIRRILDGNEHGFERARKALNQLG